MAQAEGPATVDAKQPTEAKPDSAATCVHPTVTASCTDGWCIIPKGCYVMGSPIADPCSFNFEQQHEVTITHDFKIAEHEVTQEEYQSAMGSNPSQYASCGLSCPVEGVTWHQAAAYCNNLSTRYGLTACYTCTGGTGGAALQCDEAAAYAEAKIYDCPGYRLPTEAEWEYAYRAGTTTTLYNGDLTSCAPGTADALADKVAWYEMNSGHTTHPTKQKAANAWGLYDMAGNVREWCNDWYSELLGTVPVADPWGVSKSGSNERKLLRGGDWFDGGRVLRAGYRYHYSPGNLDSATGFRCVVRK